MGEDQEQVLEQDLTNFVDTQGKHRSIINQYHLQLSLTITATYALSLQELLDTQLHEQDLFIKIP